MIGEYSLPLWPPIVAVLFGLAMVLIVRRAARNFDRAEQQRQNRKV